MLTEWLKVELMLKRRRGGTTPIQKHSEKHVWLLLRIVRYTCNSDAIAQSDSISYHYAATEKVRFLQPELDLKNKNLIYIDHLNQNYDNPILRSERFQNKTGIRISLADSKAKLPG